MIRNPERWIAAAALIFSVFGTLASFAVSQAVTENRVVYLERIEQDHYKSLNERLDRLETNVMARLDRLAERTSSGRK